MQVTETLSEGLKREFKVVVPAAELDAKVNARLDEIKDRVRINGFRPGKVPVAHLKRLYGRSTMAEVIEATVRDANNQIVSERGYKLAAEPKVTLPAEQGAVEKVIAGESDLDYTMALEIVPPIALADFKTIKLTKLTTEVTDAEVEEGIARIAEQNKPYTAKAEGEKAAKDDRVGRYRERVDRRAIGRVQGDGGEHPRLERTVGVGDANDRRRCAHLRIDNVGNARHAARECRRQAGDTDMRVLSDADGRHDALRNVRRDVDRRKVGEFV